MTHPTDDELEAMAKQVEIVERDLNNGFPMTSERGRVLQQSAAMLRACKGRVKAETAEAERTALKAELAEAVGALQDMRDHGANDYVIDRVLGFLARHQKGADT